MKDKVIFVHSSTVGLPHENVVPFAEIWRPLLETLGATVITTDEKETSDVMDFCDRQKFDVLLTDRSCPQEIISHVNVPVISSNWIIHVSLLRLQLIFYF
jgi:hypothetical protein